jgi:indole-3-glycerol phosphate synthase
MKPPESFSNAAAGWAWKRCGEIHSRGELARALRLNPGIIGINNRNILELEKDGRPCRRYRKARAAVPDDIITYSESSLRSKEEVLRAVRAGADAVLIGTALLQADDIHSFSGGADGLIWISCRILKIQSQFENGHINRY